MRQCPPLLAKLRRDVAHTIIETLDHHAAIFIVNACKDRAENTNGIGRDGAEKARMQIAIRRVHHHLFVEKPFEANAQRRLRGRPHIAIADEGDVAGQFFAVRLKKGGQAVGAGFFLAFQQDNHLARKIALDVFPGAQPFDECPELAFAIRCAPAIEALKPFLLDNLGCEGRVLPRLRFADGLHIVMPVKEHSRAVFGNCTGRVGEHQRMAFGFDNARVEAKLCKLVFKPARRLFDALRT